MNSNDRWCVRVNGGFSLQIRNRLVELGYKMEPWFSIKTIWLYFDGESVKTCDEMICKPVMNTGEIKRATADIEADGGEWAYTELHPVEVFDGTLKPYEKHVEKEKVMDKVYIEVPELARGAVIEKLRELFVPGPPMDCADSGFVFVGMPSKSLCLPWGDNHTDCYGEAGYRKITLDEFFKMEPDPNCSTCKNYECI